MLIAPAVAAMMMAAAARAEPSHGLAMIGEPALPAGFTHFPYANPDAPKGGRITYCVVGSFDNLNPFILRSLRTTARGMIDVIFGNFVFEPLMARNQDEAFGLYGLLAESVDVDGERSYAEFTLNPAARWSDGQPVTPEDVLFSYEVYAEKGRPPYSDRMKSIAKIEKTGERTVRFTFNERADREFPLVVALTPIVPKHFFDRATFDQTTMKPLVGSGPYIVSRVEPGQRIVFTRNPDYWGRDVPAKRGFDNYDEVTIEYFLNTAAQFEAFKKGICSAYAGGGYTGMDALQVERDLDFPAVKDGDVVAKAFPIGLPPVVTGFTFNTRREKFVDVNVRRALGMLYDFEWANRNMFAGRQKRTASFFQNSELSALGHPAGEKEKALLAPWPGRVPQDVMDGTYKPPQTDGSGMDRNVLRAALDVFKSAGFRLEGGKMLDARGQPFAFEILTASETEGRLAAIYQRTLERLGIGVTIRMLDDTQMQQRKQRYEFDVMIGTVGFSGTLSPGTEQIGRWGSASARVEGSFNLAGVADPAVDAAIQAMLNAREKDDYVAAVRVLDRLLISGHYMVPMQHTGEQWIAYWNYLKHPDKSALNGFQLSTWWRQD